MPVSSIKPILEQTFVLSWMLPRKEASKAAASVMAAALKKLRHVQAYILRTALLDPSVRLWKSLYDIFGCSCWVSSVFYFNLNFSMI